jgi:hypothetical protein
MFMKIGSDKDHKRDNFSTKVKETLKLRAAFICSNPGCRRMTVAPSPENSEMVQYIGECAHITAAINGGPRFDDRLTPEYRSSIENAIFLCSNCATMIDKNNGYDYKEPVIRDWKKQHELWISNNLNKSIESQSNINTYNQSGGITAHSVVNNVYNTPAPQEDTRIEHEKKLFHKIEQQLAEDKLHEILDTLAGNESIRIEDTHLLDAARDVLNRSSNEFLSLNIEVTKKNYLLALFKLNNFIHSHFDKWPHEQRELNFNICLSPQTNCDRAGDIENNQHYSIHMRLNKELLMYIKAIEKSYDTYRREIKRQLII